MPRRLTDLADVLRAAGLAVDETPVPDWKARSRGGNTSWYVDGRPTHVMLHHTASPVGSHDTIVDEQREAYSCAVTHTVRPVSNLYRGPSGIWYPLAAGPSNTNGAGSDWWGGGCPDDSMNSYAVAVEVGNNGAGEPWTDLPGLVSGIAAICRAYGIAAHNVRGHFEWAPTRKIDPASGSTVTPYSPYDRYGKFDMDRFRADVERVLHPPVAPPPTIPGGPVSGDNYLVQRNRDQALLVTDLATFAHKLRWPGDDNPAAGNDLDDMFRDNVAVLKCWNVDPATGSYWQLGEQWNEWLDDLQAKG